MNTRCKWLDDFFDHQDIWCEVCVTSLRQVVCTLPSTYICIYTYISIYKPRDAGFCIPVVFIRVILIFLKSSPAVTVCFLWVWGQSQRNDVMRVFIPLPECFNSSVNPSQSYWWTVPISATPAQHPSSAPWFFRISSAGQFILITCRSAVTLYCEGCDSLQISSPHSFPEHDWQAYDMCLLYCSRAWLWSTHVKGGQIGFDVS